jgi:hypothetical protein
METANGDNIAKFALMSGANGNVRSRTVRAWPEAEMVKSVRGVGDHWILKNNPMQSSRTYPILSDASVVLEDRTQITSEQVVQQLLAAEVQSPKTRSRHC